MPAIVSIRTLKSREIVTTFPFMRIRTAGLAPSRWLLSLGPDTCYGRLLASDGAWTAADCYRYTLRHDAVTTCWTAPATVDQLNDNLTALSDPDLPAERAAAMIARGDEMMIADRRFTANIRNR